MLAVELEHVVFRDGTDALVLLDADGLVTLYLPCRHRIAVVDRSSFLRMLA